MALGTERVSECERESVCVCVRERECERERQERAGPTQLLCHDGARSTFDIL